MFSATELSLCTGAVQQVRKNIGRWLHLQGDYFSLSIVRCVVDAVGIRADVNKLKYLDHRSGESGRYLFGSVCFNNWLSSVRTQVNKGDRTVVGVLQ